MNSLSRLSLAIASVVLCSLGLSSAAQAGTFIDFEDIDGAEDDLALNNMFFETKYGFATFGIDNNLDGHSDPNLSVYLEAIGGAKNETPGFVVDTFSSKKSTTFDTSRDAEHSLGNYFLRTSGLGGNGGNLLITYDDGLGGGMTSAASGELWDIDGHSAQESEKWLIQALDKDLQILEEIVSVEGTTNDVDSLDGKAWRWSFSRQKRDIKAIRFVFAGTKDAKTVGVAFDNFSADSPAPEAVPEPASLVGLLLTGVLVIGSRLKAGHD